MMDEFEEIFRKELGEDFESLVKLDQFTGFKVGGLAQFFFRAKKIDDLVKAVSLSYKLKIPYFILGGGYNIVVSDEGFSGLVIKNECKSIAFSEENSQVIVDSGVMLGQLINSAASKDLGGLEFLFGIPGTVGGAVYNNAGAFSYEIGDFIRTVILLKPEHNRMSIIKKDSKSMNFKYRNSILKGSAKKTKFPMVILTIKLQLVRRRRDEILDLMQENFIKKKESQPIGEKSAGSFFKNVGSAPEQTAGYFLDQAGMKKQKVGGAIISKKHANFIINQKNAKASEIKALAEKAKEIVKDKFNYDLEEEVEYIGKW
jgi:UDP-N-acetylmuramate dehydrogenase